MTERDFVLNNIFEALRQHNTAGGCSLEDSIEEVKRVYHVVCENTSEGSDEELILQFGFYWIPFRLNEINTFTPYANGDSKVLTKHALYELNEGNTIKFKQWFERKRG